MEASSLLSWLCLTFIRYQIPRPLKNMGRPQHALGALGPPPKQ